MEPSQLPLLLAADELGAEVEREPLDRLRMQKGVFLLEMRGPRSWRDLHRFVPYDWGPYSRDLAAQVDELVDRELIFKERTAGRRYSRYRTTDAGDSEVSSILASLSQEQRNLIGEVRRYITNRSFNQLLREVYAAYPEYAGNSRFRGWVPK